MDDLENSDNWELGEDVTAHAAYAAHVRATQYSIRFEGDDGQRVAVRAEFLGLTTNEYIRRLVLDDLSRSVVKMEMRM